VPASCATLMPPVVDVSRQIAALEAEYDRLRAKTEHDDLSGGDADLARGVNELFTRTAAAAERVLPRNSAYAKQADQAVRLHPRTGGVMNPGGSIVRLFGVLRAFRDDLEAGFLVELEASIQSGVFDDFLDMAEHVRSEIHRTPAAVIAGFTSRSTYENSARLGKSQPKRQMVARSRPTA